MTKGQISRETTVWCGLCSLWNTKPGTGNSSWWRREGWRMTREHGWVCPGCRDKLKAGWVPADDHPLLEDGSDDPSEDGSS